MTANLAVDAVFGADDPEGAALKERFNAYYSQADAEAKQKGEALAAAIEAGMRDGFLDETEQETINALRQELAQITSRALSVDTQGALLRFQMEAEDIELTPDSLTGLMERAQTAAQAGLDEISQNGELLLTATYNMAAAEDWSEDELREEIARINAQGLRCGRAAENLERRGQSRDGGLFHRNRTGGGKASAAAPAGGGRC